MASGAKVNHCKTTSGLEEHVKDPVVSSIATPLVASIKPTLVTVVFPTNVDLISQNVLDDDVRVDNEQDI